MISINKEEISEKPPNDDSEIVLRVNGISKKFCRDLKRSLLYGVQDIASEVIGLREKSENLRSKEFWALQNVSFELRRGESIGLVGKNGSGKSTLLRIIAGLIKPDTGLVEINGRVAPLIALGAGFNPILTGRENIYANMSILGLSKKEIDDKFDAVVEFAEIGDAIDSPVQTYSSGMAARLGFSCAIHTEPDILLIDEVLAVGDIRFRIKCYQRLAELREAGTAFILVSHNPISILSICDSAVYLSKGKLLMTGTAQEVTSQYEEDLAVNTVAQSSGELILPEREQDFGLQIRSVSFKDSEENTLDILTSGEPAKLKIICQAYENLSNVTVTFIATDLSKEKSRVLFLESQRDGKVFSFTPGEITIELDLPHCCFKPGSYSLNITIKNGKHRNVLDIVNSFFFNVQSNQNMSECQFFQPRTWSHKEISPPTNLQTIDLKSQKINLQESTLQENK